MCSGKFIKTQTSCSLPLLATPRPSLCASVPHKFHGNQPAASASHPNFICCTAAGLLSPPSLLLYNSRLDFTLFLSRFAPSSASCATVRQAEILLPLFMLSLCNILPAAFAAVALGALVFNILQLVKALLAP